MREMKGQLVGGLSNALLVRNAWFWFSRNVTLGMIGTWTLDVFINGQSVVTAPVSVVQSTDPIVNHPPLPIAWVALDPPAPLPTDVPMCLVRTGSLYRRDPDYDLVRGVQTPTSVQRAGGLQRNP